MRSRRSEQRYWTRLHNNGWTAVVTTDAGLGGFVYLAQDRRPGSRKPRGGWTDKLSKAQAEADAQVPTHECSCHEWRLVE
jgi:hypothetical protein